MPEETISLQEAARISGVAPSDIHADFAWNAYWHFDRYLAALDPQAPADFGNYFRWSQQEQRRQARYLVNAESLAEDDRPSTIVSSRPYRDTFLRLRYVYVLKRSPNAP